MKPIRVQRLLGALQKSAPEAGERRKAVGTAATARRSCP